MAKRGEKRTPHPSLSHKKFGERVKSNHKKFGERGLFVEYKRRSGSESRLRQSFVCA
jgi:hypothetical protein